MHHGDESPYPSDAEESPDGEPPQSWPEWANSPIMIPAQTGFSWASQTSFQLRHKEIEVPMPLGFEHQKRPREPTKIKKALDQQTALVCDAYVTNACLSTIFTLDDLHRFLKCEREELLASWGHVATDPHAAPPRKFALTLCVPDTEHSTCRHHLLDAMAYFARFGGAERAVSVARMAVLSNQIAQEYAISHNERLKKAPRLMLVWLASDGPGAHKNTDISSVEVPHASTAEQCLTLLVRCAATLFLTAEQDPPNALVRCIEAPEQQICGSYIASVKEATDEFWGEVLCYTPFTPIDTLLDFEDHRAFLKIVPSPQKGQPQPNQEHYSFGMLAYAQGMHEEARDFCIQARRGEKEILDTRDPHRPTDLPYGLRFPLSADEMALNLHVLHVSTSGTSFAGRLSCFGNRAAPGKPVCIHPNATMPRLVFQLVRFDEHFCESRYVLPVMQTQVDSGNKHEHEHQWDAVVASIFQYHTAWGLAAKYAPEKRPKSTFNLTKAYPPPSREDALFSAMVGVVRSGPTRLGDIYDQVKKLNYAAPHVTRFLTVAITEYGAHTSVAEGLDKMVQSHQNQSDALDDMQAKLDKLEQADMRLKAAAPKKVVVPAVSAALLPSVLSVMGLKPKKARVIPAPMTALGVLAVVYAYSFARGAPEDKTDAKWGKKNAMALTTFDGIGKIIGQLDVRLTVLLRINADGSADFLRARNEGRAAENITALEAMELSRRDEVAFLQFNVNDAKLSPLMRA